MTANKSVNDGWFQPYVNDAQILLCAPSQAWLREGGDTSHAIDGVYHGDTRFLRDISLSARPVPLADSSGSQAETAATRIEWISSSTSNSKQRVAVGIPRALDDADADPNIRIVRRQNIGAGSFDEIFEIQSKIKVPVAVRLMLTATFEATPMMDIRVGRPASDGVHVSVVGDRAAAVSNEKRVDACFSGASVVADGPRVDVTWDLQVFPGGTCEARWSMRMADTSMVVRSAQGTWPQPPLPDGIDPDLQRWARKAWSDLGALRLLRSESTDVFFGAGAPWYLTLFGRDSLWAARLLLPYELETAESTLRVLAGLQASEHDVWAASDPGKIIHELRAEPLHLPAEGVSIPERYYGSVDATLLWVCLFGDLWNLREDKGELVYLFPALRGCLHWLLEHGDSDGDGFIDYFDGTATGLKNQGWKDSADAIQWRDGALADGPLALCEVQGYAYEALLVGAKVFEWAQANGTAELFAGLGSDITSERLRERASELSRRFGDRFWVTTPDGTYPAVALDGWGRPVDSLTSNIGHLVGTGIMTRDQEVGIADLLLREDMSSGYGIRTLSARSSGYWPLSYHVGSVWAHDTAICVRGMIRAGLIGQARVVSRQLTRAAVSFGYLMPELFTGDSVTTNARAVAYPAACRPQAWSAAAAFTCVQAESEVPA